MGKTVHKASGLSADLAEFVQNLARSLFDPYRPEQHYMRGPGPKWHAKHDHAFASSGIGGSRDDSEYCALGGSHA